MKSPHLLFTVFHLTLVAKLAMGGEFTFAPPVNLGPLVNTVYDDQGQSLSSDEMTIYYQSTIPNNFGRGDIWMATRNSINGGFESPVNLGEPVNGPGYESGPLITSDGLSLYFASDRNGSTDLFVASRASPASGFMTIRNLGAGVNTSYSEVTPMVSENGLELFFRRSGDPTGYGGADVWYSNRAIDDGEFLGALNLGSNVNSAYDEGGPFLSSDGLKLIIWSNRPGGFGSRDLYVCSREAVGLPFGVPVNIGPKVNSAASETYPRLTNTGLYFSSTRSVGYGENDIYFAPFDSDSDGLPDMVESNTGTYLSSDDTGSDPDDSDSDDDGLGDGVEVNTHNTNPNLADSDDDGFDDRFELSIGFDPNSDTSTPDTLSFIKTAVEFHFYSAVGSTYSIEASEDLQEWSIVEEGIAGNGGVISRLYSTNGQTVRVFRARKN